MATARTKQNIIKRYGSSVVITSRPTPYPTTAIVGTSVRKTSIRLGDIENFLRGNFVPSDNLQNGEVILHVPTGEQYITLGIYKEVINNEYVADICNMLRVNSTYTAQRLQETADQFGNITKTPIILNQDTPAYTEVVTEEMRQTDPGLLESCEFKLYTTNKEIKLYDQILITTDGWTREMQVVSVTYSMLHGINVLQLATDIRSVK